MSRWMGCGAGDDHPGHGAGLGMQTDFSVG